MSCPASSSCPSPEVCHVLYQQQRRRFTHEMTGKMLQNIRCKFYVTVALAGQHTNCSTAHFPATWRGRSCHHVTKALRADLTHNLTDISMSQMKKHSNDAIAAEYDTPQATEMRTTTSDDAGPPAKPGKSVPHYLSKTMYRQDRTFCWLFAFSVLFSVAYFAIRVVYIVTERVKVGMTSDATPEQIRNVKRQNDSAIIYSSIVLVAEFGGFLLTHLGQQMFTRQRTRFGKMTDANVERMKQVQPLLHGAPPPLNQASCLTKPPPCIARPRRGQVPACEPALPHAGCSREGNPAEDPRDRVHVRGAPGHGGALCPAPPRRNAPRVCRTRHLGRRRRPLPAGRRRQARLRRTHARTGYPPFLHMHVPHAYTFHMQRRFLRWSGGCGRSRAVQGTAWCT